MAHETTLVGTTAVGFALEAMRPTTPATAPGPMMPGSHGGAPRPVTTHAPLGENT